MTTWADQFIPPKRLNSESPGSAEMVLNEIRRWLSEGATISATDRRQPLLVLLPDGSCNSNVTVKFPPSALASGESDSGAQTLNAIALRPDEKAGELQ